MVSTGALDAFTKAFTINTDLADVKFQKFNVEPYLDEKNKFGEEKICLLYTIDLTVFNTEVGLRILSFNYDNHAEVLKLAINIPNELFSNEIAPCRNFLQRKRNLNLMFEVLIKFAKLFEMRRLIYQTVFERQPQVVALEDDVGITIKCCSDDFRIKFLELHWMIAWDVDKYEVSDLIEFYLNYSVLQDETAEKVKEKLQVLVDPIVDFHPKLKLWKLVMRDLYAGHCLKTHNSKKGDVFEILDSSDEDCVIETIQETPDEVLVIE